MHYLLINALGLIRIVCLFVYLFNFVYSISIRLGELDHAINLSRPKLIFSSMAVAPRALKISGKNPFVKKVILMELNGSKQMNKRLSTKLTISYLELISSIKVGVMHSSTNIGGIFMQYKIESMSISGRRLQRI